MDTVALLREVALQFTRLIVGVSTILGIYLLFRGASLLHRVFGVALIAITLLFLIHHYAVIKRGSMDAGDT